jgi:hypothetical protein
LVEKAAGADLEEAGRAASPGASRPREDRSLEVGSSGAFEFGVCGANEVREVGVATANWGESEPAA